MKICCVSDLHGHFPEIPDCDLLLLAGDYCPVTVFQDRWFRGQFAPWLKKLSKRMKIIGVAGNHDLIFEDAPHLVPEMDWTYLQDSGCEFDGLNIYGSPHQKIFYSWAFNRTEEEMSAKWDLIPTNTDIMVLHGPPFGYGDYVARENEHTGSPSLLKRIQEIQPKIVLFGHIHQGRGKYAIRDTVALNCSLVNEAYRAVNKPWMVTIESGIVTVQ
jgi:Icc-related predicted phosphoesterase